MNESARKWFDESVQKRDALPTPSFGLRRAAVEDGTSKRNAGAFVGSLSDGLKNMPFHPEQLESMAAFAPVLIYWLFFYPIDKLVGVLPWLGAVFTRFFILVGARAAAGGAAGIDMLGAAFDARRTGEMPAGAQQVTVPATIERDLEARLDAAVRVNLAPLRHALDRQRSPSPRCYTRSTTRTSGWWISSPR
jgi:hypothetical protein